MVDDRFSSKENIPFFLTYLPAVVFLYGYTAE